MPTILYCQYSKKVQFTRESREDDALCVFLIQATPAAVRIVPDKEGAQRWRKKVWRG